jgi:hypothetical protein
MFDTDCGGVPMAHEETFVLPVPEILTANYLVAIPAGLEPGAMVTREIREQFTGELRDLTLDLCEREFLGFQVLPMAQLPPMLLELVSVASRVDPVHVRRFAQAERVAVIAASSPPQDQPRHDWAARVAAIALATGLSADLVDPVEPWLITVDEARRALPDATGRWRLSEWVRIIYSPGERGYWCTSSGLTRFGLPELQIDDVPPQYVREWGYALTGVAYRLLRTWLRVRHAHPDAAFVELPRRLAVSRADRAAAYGHHDPDPTAATVWLEVDPATDLDAATYLTVQPPPEAAGCIGEFIAQACDLLYGPECACELHNRPTDEPATDEVARARRSLPDARRRFLTGDLPAGGHLMVKYRLTSGRELAWAYVTSWTDPDRVLGASANHSESDDLVRVGRPVVVARARIVDWAIWSETEGILPKPRRTPSPASSARRRSARPQVT